MGCSDCSCESKDAKKWFLGALVIATALTVFLFFVDHGLTTSEYEQQHANELKRLRTAATSLPSGVTDTRQLSLPNRE